MKKSFLLLVTILLITGCSAEEAGEDSASLTASSTATSTIMKVVGESTNQETQKETEGNTINQSITINTKESAVNWGGKKFTGHGHEGTINIKEGNLTTNIDQNITGGEFTIDMSSIKDDEGSKSLEGYLKNKDFFDVVQFPEARLLITHIFPDGELKDKSEHTITADLTIKGITRDIVFPATVALDEKDLEITANFEIDRTRWNIKYGSGKFFKGLGDKVINDEINFKITLKAKLPKQETAEAESEAIITTEDSQENEE